MLAQGNLPAITVQAIYLIFTTKEGERELLNSQVFARLKQLMPVEIYHIELGNKDAYKIITECHQIAFNFADAKDAGVFIAMPDCVYADNYYMHLQEKALAGACLISVPNFRINLEDSRLELINLLDPNKTLTIDSQSLMQIGMRNLHHMTKAHIWEHTEGYLLPSTIFWRVANNGGLLGRYFYACFSYVYPENKYTQLYGTMDLDYIFHACPDPATHYACTSSDDALVLEMTTKDRFCAGFPKVFIEHLQYYAEHLNEYQIDHSRHLFKLSTGLASKDDWKRAMDESMEIFAKVHAHSQVS